MLTSMTGFGSKAKDIVPLGKVTVELRSSNHKFLETVLHVPEGFLSLEDRIKKEIEAKVKRGRIVCAVNIGPNSAQGVSLNHALVKNYISHLNSVKNKFNLEGKISLDLLMHLPGVLSVAEQGASKEKLWPHLKFLVGQAVEELVKMRQKEGRALCKYLKGRGQNIKRELDKVSARYKVVLEKKVAKLKNSDEKSSFLKDSDIGEELQRLEYHIKNFTHKLGISGPVGKELDFIAQEMQREANTIGAKSVDSLLSAKVVQIKSQIEKIREQVQNVE